MKIKPNMFFVGGAKGTGKTLLTSSLCFDLGLERVETGKIVFDYIGSNSPLRLNEYICRGLLSFKKNDVLVDTHYVAYPHKEGMERSFQRGLDMSHVALLAESYDVYPCHIILNPLELLKRRQRDSKKRITSLELVEEELTQSKVAYDMYIKELKREPFVVENIDMAETKEKLANWVKHIISLQR